jgi:2-dehydro-3-deoxyphosphogluconate aldolase/(4S)-4-hydroxy-2-oxoglutarate aldolase
MQNKDQVIQGISEQGLLPLFFHADASVSLEVVKALYKAGIRYIEYTNRGESALQNFRSLKEHRAEMPDLQLGIGTIKTATEAADFIAAGADFIISPVVNPEVGQAAEAAGLLWIPGCFSPTEIHQARNCGAKLVKIFPANILGPDFIASVKELFPGQLYMPTGGVEVEEQNISTWFRAGVCAVGMGSKLISKEILENRSYDELYQSTSAALNLVRHIRNQT